MFLPKEIAAAWQPQTRCIQRHGSRVAWNSSTIAWWCLKACISVKLSWQTISPRRFINALVEVAAKERVEASSRKDVVQQGGSGALAACACHAGDLATAGTKEPGDLHLDTRASRPRSHEVGGVAADARVAHDDIGTLEVGHVVTA